MKILATRIHSPSDDPDVMNYEVKKGGGILQKGETLSIVRSSAKGPRVESATFKSAQTNIPLKIGIGTGCKSTLPIISEGIGIPRIIEFGLPGRVTFKGSFNADSFKLNSKGITNPRLNSRREAFCEFVGELRNSGPSDIVGARPQFKRFLLDVEIGAEVCFHTATTHISLA